MFSQRAERELNIDVNVGKFCTEVIHDYENISIDLMAYYCSIAGGSIRLSVHDKYKWVKINDLLNYDLLQADVKIAKKVLEDYYE